MESTGWAGFTGASSIPRLLFSSRPVTHLYGRPLSSFRMVVMLIALGLIGLLVVSVGVPVTPCAEALSSSRAIGLSAQVAPLSDLRAFARHLQRDPLLSGSQLQMRHPSSWFMSLVSVVHVSGLPRQWSQPGSVAFWSTCSPAIPSGDSPGGSLRR